MNMSTAVPRTPRYWAHKARALLLPTPLAIIDHDGEAERIKRIEAWLAKGNSRDWRESAWFDRCHQDALGVHVPSFVTRLSSRVEDLTRSDREVSLPALVHPMTGRRDHEASDELPCIADLRACYDDWESGLCARHSVPVDSAGYNALWRDWLHSIKHEWLRRLPGHPLVGDHSVFAQRSIAAALVGARLDGGQACILNMHCGPVQSFITAARRTSDLWLGSYLVNLLTYQAVRSIAANCGPDSIVYPYLATLPLADLDARGCGARDGVQTWLRAAQPNRFVAIVDGSNARCLAVAAANAVHSRWTSMGSRVLEGIKQLSPKSANNDAFKDFDSQIAEHLEIDAVLQPWPDDVATIRTMLEQAERTVADEPVRENAGETYAQVFALGRQTLTAQRELTSFVRRPGTHRPKCTLCGGREQLGPIERAKQRKWWLAVRESLHRAPKDHDENKGTLVLRSGEGLCAVCLTKRLGHRFDLAGPDREFGLDWAKRNHRVMLRFPSVASIASAPFRSYLAQFAGHEAVREWLDALRELYQELDFEPPGNLLPGLADIGWGKYVLDVDGSWLYARSYEANTIVRDFDRETSKAAELEPLVEQAKRSFARVRKTLSPEEDASLTATPYYAIIVADVDEMGKWLDGTHRDRRTLLEVLKEYGMARLDDLDREQQRLLEQKRCVTSALHAEVSRRQGQLSTQTIHEIVEGKAHLGRVVYAGGDDLLAFVPLHCVWSCLSSVHKAFKHPDALGHAIGVSAGIAIQDWRVPLSQALERARKAEERAKHRGNRAAITLDIRSGAEIKLDLDWERVIEIPRLVEALEEAPLLRPTAAEQLRGELATLGARGLEAAFRQRVATLLGIHGALPSWLDAMIHTRDPDSAGQVLDMLLMLRFLARQRGGIPFTREVQP